MKDKIINWLREITGYYELSKELNDRILAKSEELELLRSDNYALHESLENTNEELIEVKEQLRVANEEIFYLTPYINIENFKNWFISRWGAQTWSYNWDGEGSKPVHQAFRYKDPKTGPAKLINLRDKIINRYNINNPTKTELIERVKQYFTVRNHWTYVFDHQNPLHPGVVDYWQEIDVSIDRRRGDCFAGYEEIYTKDGLKRIDEIKKGDVVLSYNFNKKEYVYKPVIDVWSKGKLQVNRIHFRNGQHIDVSKDHPMWVRQHQKFSNYEKQYLSDIDLSRWWKRKIPIAKKIPYNIEDVSYLTEELCLVVGHFIAEGSIEGSHVQSSGFELIEYIIPILEKYNIPFTEFKNNSGVVCIRFLKSDFKDLLKRQMKNSFDIHLEEIFFKLPTNKLESLLHGMWLGDGTKQPEKSGKDWIYSTSSEQLAKDIQRIGLQIGRTFHIWKQEKHGGVGIKPIWRITYTPNSHFLKDFGYNDISEVSISYIEKLDSVEMFDLTVKDTHTVIMKNGIITHQCEDLAILMHMIIRTMFDEFGYEDDKWRLVFTAGSLIGYGGHAYNLYLHNDAHYYTIESTFDLEGNFRRSWLKTPVVYHNLYENFWGFASPERSQRNFNWAQNFDALRKIEMEE